MVKLNAICRPKQWKTISSSNLLDHGFPVYGANGQIGFYSEYTHENPTLMITCRGATCGSLNISVPKSYINGNAMALDSLDTEKVDIMFLYYFLKQRGFQDVISGSAQPQITGQGLNKIEVPLPPLEEQKRIAAILDKAYTIRQKRHKATALADDFLRSVFLDMFGDPITNPKGWDKKPLGRVFKLSSGNGLTAKEMDADGRYPVYGGNGISGLHSDYMFDSPQLIIGRVGIYCGAIHITEPRAWVTDNALYVKEYLCKININYLAQLLEILNLNQFAGRAAQPLVSGSRIYPIEAILPPIEEQVKFEEIKRAFTNSLSKNLSSKAEIDVFFNTLSRHAFSGQL
ncbi:restriction endonuclease subunit S [Aeromonas jandaei]|nr:restriction endonuclease subunit S [Aeromonas jandaei]